MSLCLTFVQYSRLTSLRWIKGDEWKDLRKRVIAGFAPQHLLSLTSQMLDKSQRFFDHLDRLVESGEEFGLGELTTNLAFDVIGKQHSEKCANDETEVSFQ